MLFFAGHCDSECCGMSEAEPDTRDVLQSLPHVLESCRSLCLTRGQISEDVYGLIVVPEISFL